MVAGAGDECERKTTDNFIWLPGSNNAPNAVITFEFPNCRSQ